MKTVKYISLILMLVVFLQTVFASSAKTTAATSNLAVVIDTVNPAKPILGKYNIYSGIPSMYIGHFELKEGGSYIVALSSDENSYATGTYTFNGATNIIEWKTGFFWQKKWGGKVVTNPGNAIRIEFNRVTYGDNTK